MKPCIGYVRVSTDKQENSADAQERRIRAQAMLKDLELTDVIVDFDEFSGDLNRPGVQKVLDLVKAKGISAVIVTKLDRLSRSTRDVIDLIELFGKKGVALVSITETLDTESPMGRFFVRMIASIAELEREMIGARTAEGMHNLKEQGFPIGTAPYGFTAQLRPVINGKAQRMPLIPNAAEQAIIARVREAYNSGHSYQEIADTLNAQGHRTRKGGIWQKMYIGRMLKK